MTNELVRRPERSSGVTRRRCLLFYRGGVDVRVLKTVCAHVSSKALCGVLAGAILSLGSVNSASAQAPAANDPNPGALTFTGALDVPSVYFFRGIRQERDPAFTLFPAGDIGIALSSDGKGGLKSSSINFGLWNSLNTGSSGSDGPAGRLHYEEDFYATLNLGFGGGWVWPRRSRPTRVPSTTRACPGSIPSKRSCSRSPRRTSSTPTASSPSRLVARTQARPTAAPARARISSWAWDRAGRSGRYGDAGRARQAGHERERLLRAERRR